MDWICLAYDRDRLRTVVSAVMIFLVPLNVEYFLTSSGQVSFSRRTKFHSVYIYIYIYIGLFTKFKKDRLYVYNFLFV